MGRSTGVEAIGHVLLKVSDLARAEEFYVGLLGFSVRKTDSFRDGRPLVVMNEGLGLTTGGPAGESPVEHIAFAGHGVERLVARARSAGVTVVRGPEASTYGTSLYLLDPDGNQIEIFEEGDHA